MIDLTLKHTLFALVVGYFVAIDVSALTLCSAREFQERRESWFGWSLRHGAMHALFLAIGLGVFGLIGHWLGPIFDPFFRNIVAQLGAWLKALDWVSLSALFGWIKPFLSSTKSIIALIGVIFIIVLYRNKLADAGNPEGEDTGNWRLLSWLESKGYSGWVMTIYVALDMNYITPMLRTTLEDDGISVVGSLWFIVVVGLCVFGWAVFWWIFGRILLESKYEKRERVVGWLLVIMVFAEPLCCYYITIHVVAQAVFAIEPGTLERLPYLAMASLMVLLTAYTSLGRRALQNIVDTQFHKGKTLFPNGGGTDPHTTSDDQEPSYKSSQLYRVWTVCKKPAVFLVVGVFIGTQFFLRRLECFSADNDFWSLEAMSDLTHAFFLLAIALYTLGHTRENGTQSVNDWLQMIAVFIRERAARFALIFMTGYALSALYLIPTFWSPDSLSQWFNQPTVLQRIWLSLLILGTLLILLVRWLQFIRKRSISAVIVLGLAGTVGLTLLQFVFACVIGASGSTATACLN